MLRRFNMLLILFILFSSSNSRTVVVVVVVVIIIISTSISFTAQIHMTDANFHVIFFRSLLFKFGMHMMYIHTDCFRIACLSADNFPFMRLLAILCVCVVLLFGTWKCVQKEITSLFFYSNTC